MSVLTSMIVTVSTNEELTSSSELSDTTTYNSSGIKILSRKKRFLIFPEGSSLQLVFCLTYPSINVIGDIILWGNTAALAWELPQDPYSPFDHKADPLHRRKDDTKNVYYTNEKGKLLFTVPYKRKPIVNPAFAKRSVDSQLLPSKSKTSEHQPETDMKLLRNRMHQCQTAREFLKVEHSSQASVEFHRRSRKGLFAKLELFLKALGMNGRECVRRTLCEVGKSPGVAQGSFVEEIVRAVFTLPKSQSFSAALEEYDAAHGAHEDCEVLYPDCEPGNSIPEIKLL